MQRALRSSVRPTSAPSCAINERVSPRLLVPATLLGLLATGAGCSHGEGPQGRPASQTSSAIAPTSSPTIEARDRAPVPTLTPIERERLLAALLARGEPGCDRAASALRRGIRVFEDWPRQDPKAVAEEFSGNDDDGWEDPQLQAYGHEESMAALPASPLRMVDTVSLEDMPFERWFIHLDSSSHAVVACHGIVLTR